MKKKDFHFDDAKRENKQFDIQRREDLRRISAEKMNEPVSVRYFDWGFNLAKRKGEKARFFLITFKNPLDPDYVAQTIKKAFNHIGQTH